ncbi:TadE/TadG family type IV pilus assembly protein [Vibrio hippocampi]|uniref:Pilus assembly protein TadG n=1 Tax=Vibrio hippocampi TaxID=654686 RepID=A0ABM8ZLV0_9VIBR|nr:TadE/TadG family type IV pilus assembly protein [Vibrio hippocampi]CAH0529503.1 hypothetical protein VHP8226_03257 [Vibrio hippocampi]
MGRYHGYSGRRRQSGVAAVWMAFTLVPVLGISFWAVEGTRYIQETNRLRDGAQAAASAVTIANDPSAADSLAALYINQYARSHNSAVVTAVQQHQLADPDSGQEEWIQYTVDVTTTHTSWFANQLIPAFNTSENLTGQAVAKKYPLVLGDKNIDIVFVSDFSGSMSWRWGSSRSCTSTSCKIEDLKQAVKSISDKLLCNQVGTDAQTGEAVCEDEDQSSLADTLLNRVAVIPFNIRTRENLAGANYTVSQLRYRDDVETNNTSLPYDQVDWNFWRSYNPTDVRRCSRRSNRCPSGINDAQDQANRIVSVFNIGRNTDEDTRFYADVYDYVDFQGTVDNMFTSTFPQQTTHYQLSSMALYNGYGSTGVQFSNIPLTNVRASIDAIDSMSANGNTAAFQGMLSGFQAMAAGRPDTEDEEELAEYQEKIKMVIVLSDGVESPENGILPALVNQGLCDKAREAIPGLYIAVIGIDFAASEQSGFQDCVLNVNEDIIDVENTDEFIEKLEELIRKGSQGVGETRLYG